MLDRVGGDCSSKAATDAVRRWLKTMHWADLAAIAVLAGIFVLVLATFADYGVTFDEGVQDTYGKSILSWYATLGADRTAVEFADLYFYGGLFDTVAALLNLVSPFHHYETRHLLNGLVGVLGLAGCWQLGRYLGGALAGFLALCLLALMPSWYGMMFFNPKDIPFATGMVWSLYYLSRLAVALPVPPRRLVTTFGLVAGLTLATRVGGLLLFGYLGVIVGLHVLTAAWPDPRRLLRAALPIALRVIVPTVAIAWVVMLVFWPYAQINPLLNPFRAYEHFAGYEPGIGTLFFGKVADENYRPLFYLPVYILLKLPDIAVVLLLAAAGLGAVGLWRRRRWSALPRPVLPVVLGLVVPLGYVLLLRPELYDAERHFLFVLPPLAVVLALVAQAICHRMPVPARGWAAAIAVFAVVVHTDELRRLHPYEYVFYNDLIGGVAGAKGLFETEYWGAAVTEAAEGLNEVLAPLPPSVQVMVDVCGDDSGLDEYLPHSVAFTEDAAQAQYYISTTRDNCDQTVPGQEIIRIEREGVPFAVVKELPSALALRRGEPRRPLPNGRG